MKRSKTENQKMMLVFLTATSVFGLIFSTYSAFFFKLRADEFAFRNQTIGLVFGLICSLGIIVSVYPSFCFMQTRFGKSVEANRKILKHKSLIQSHHPNCQGFKNHILKVDDMKFCASCSGLFFGGVIALFGTGWYFFANLNLGEPIVIILIGVSGAFFGLFQSATPRFCSGGVRFIGGLFFVVGSFLMLTGMDGVLKNTGFDLFFVALCILLIYTRIEWSSWDHREICSRCQVEYCQ